MKVTISFFNALGFYDFLHVVISHSFDSDFSFNMLFLSRCTKWKERSYITLTEEGNERWWRRSGGWMARRQRRELARTPGWCILCLLILGLMMILKTLM